MSKASKMTDALIQCDACCGWRPKWQFHDCQPQLRALKAALECAKDVLNAVESGSFLYTTVQHRAAEALIEITRLESEGVEGRDE